MTETPPTGQAELFSSGLSMELLIGASLGTLIGLLLAFPAIILETSRRVQNLPLLIDVHVWRGKKLSEGEIFAVGLFLHLVMAMLYGLMYVLFAQQGWLFITNAPYTIGSMLIFAFFAWVVLQLILLPILGIGLFGRKEGPTVWFETLISLLLEGALLWIVIQYYSPIFFVA